MAKAILHAQLVPNPVPQQLPWCICGHCRDMHNALENVCCRNRICITTGVAFDTVMLDTDVLSVCIVGRSEDFAEDAVYTPGSYCKAPYRHGSSDTLGELIEKFFHLVSYGRSVLIILVLMECI